MDERVAVVVITHNRREEVLRTLGHLAELPERPRIVVVDNGSEDDTVAAIAKHFPSIRVIATGRNLGAAARTLGVREVTEPYVALCDDDTWWNPGDLSAAATLFDAHPKLAIATARVLVGPDEKEDTACIPLANSPLPREPNMPGPALLGFLAGACVVRRSAFLDAGGFEPRFFLGGEEELLAIDLAVRGWWLCYVPELVVHHYPSPRRDVYCRNWHLLRNRLWFTWLRRPVPTALRQSLDLFWHSPWDRVSVRGIASAVYGLPWVLRHRRRVPARVERQLCMLEDQK